MNDWFQVLLEPASLVLRQIGLFLVNMLLVLIILLLGWILAKIVKAFVTKGLRAIQLDTLSDRVELDEILAKGGIKYSISELIGIVCYWLLLLVTFVVAVNAVGLTIAADLLNRIILYVPNIVAAIFILVLGMFAATLLRNIVQTAANNAGLLQAHFLSKLVEILIMVFAIAISLEQLNIGAKTIQMVITIVLSTLGLGLALAFGLGCKDIAAKYTAEVIEKFKSKK